MRDQNIEKFCLKCEQEIKFRSANETTAYLLKIGSVNVVEFGTMMNVFDKLTLRSKVSLNTIIVEYIAGNMFSKVSVFDGYYIFYGNVLIDGRVSYDVFDPGGLHGVVESYSESLDWILEFLDAGDNFRIDCTFSMSGDGPIDTLCVAEFEIVMLMEDCEVMVVDLDDKSVDLHPIKMVGVSIHYKVVDFNKQATQNGHFSVDGDVHGAENISVFCGNMWELAANYVHKRLEKNNILIGRFSNFIFDPGGLLFGQ